MRLPKGRVLGEESIEIELENALLLYPTARLEPVAVRYATVNRPAIRSASIGQVEQNASCQVCFFLFAAAHARCAQFGRVHSSGELCRAFGAFIRLDVGGHAAIHRSVSGVQEALVAIERARRVEQIFQIDEVALDCQRGKQSFELANVVASIGGATIAKGVLPLFGQTGACHQRSDEKRVCRR